MEFQEQRYKAAVSGKRSRPFSQSAGVSNRGYSRRLERIITDFGADHPFGQVSGKLDEHYGVSMSSKKIRQITEGHAVHCQLFLENHEDCQATEELNIISETDGCMLPVVEYIEPENKEGSDNLPCLDKRKNKTVFYKECRLGLAHAKGSTELKFNGTMGGVEEAGQAMKKCVDSINQSEERKVHGVGDGATWIADQLENQFGAEGSYLLDLYHVCDYLAAAAKTCKPGDEKSWIKEQKELLKKNEWRKVLVHLLPYVEPNAIVDSDAPVRACHRYLNNRSDQLNYKDAIEKGLPIGSGEIESAHRYVVQKRLKVSGGWWKVDILSAMLSLRICRANNLWNEYWENAA